MTTEEYQTLVGQSQPHPVFSSDWSTFDAIDFADTLLPKVSGYIAKGLRLYDGAALFSGLQKSESKVMQIMPEKEPISLIGFTYPKDVKAASRKNRVRAGKNEILAFIEAAQNNALEISFKFGYKFKNFLKDYFKTNNLTKTVGFVEDKIFKTDIASFQQHFGNKLVHYNMMDFIGKTIGVDLVAVNEKTALKVKLLGIKAVTSEPSDNKNRKVKEKKQKTIVIDFEILNQPVINYSLIVYRGKQQIEEIVFLPPLDEVEISAKRSSPENQIENAAKAGRVKLFRPGKYKIVWNCTENGIFETEKEDEKLKIKVLAVAESGQTAYAQQEILIKETVDNAEVDNFIIVNDNKVFGSDILKRQSQIKDRIGVIAFYQLPREEQLIIDLSVIMVKIGWLHGAYCQLHWLEGSGSDVYFANEFVLGYKRSHQAITEMLENLEQAEFASYIDETNYSPTLALDSSAPRFLYDVSLKYILKAYEKAVKYLQTLEDFTEDNFGNFDFNEPSPKMNFVRSYPIGSEFLGYALGDFDDLGAAFGRLSLRVYVNGAVTDQELNSTEFSKFNLEIKETAYRFFDEFTFNDEDGKNYGDVQTEDQRLGDWKYNLNDPEPPEKSNINIEWITLRNSNFRSLAVKEIGITPRDFNVLTKHKTLNKEEGLKVKHPIMFFFKA